MKDKRNLDKPTRKRFQFIIENTSGADILNLACSEGYLHNYLQETFPKSRIIGVDFSGYDYGSQFNKPDVHHDLNVYPYPFKSGNFDTIVAGEIIEHIHNPTLFMKECNRLLKRKGKLIITTPNACGVHHAMENPDKSEYLRPYGHIQLFSEAILRRLAGYCKFTFIKSFYTYYTKYLPLWIINKRFGANLCCVFIKAEEC